MTEEKLPEEGKPQEQTTPPEKKTRDNVLESHTVLVRRAQEHAMQNRTYRIARAIIYGIILLFLLVFALIENFK